MWLQVSFFVGDLFILSSLGLFSFHVSCLLNISLADLYCTTSKLTEDNSSWFPFFFCIKDSTMLSVARLEFLDRLHSCPYFVRYAVLFNPYYLFFLHYQCPCPISDILSLHIQISFQTRLCFSPSNTTFPIFLCLHPAALSSQHNLGL